ncbi:DUF4184 family protein [Streptomyces sp. TM32]|uniref:DUF4184 family protein n=1 Tax=Streptomyces sp. TM32 TaxID=1652669 RepID=UPI0010114C2B|nr:DUF4184 family protein [Streptomyces sp. TM32]RXS87881.1 DUF4184 family protein [Streptomyces sp. TM32]
MPYTLSHVAAVLPGIRRDGGARGPLLASALVAGSFSPDMTYFADSLLPGAMAYGHVTHDPTGPLLVDALVSALLVGGWLLVREPMVALLPRAWQGRVYTLARGRSWRGRAVVPLVFWFWVSAVLGAATHIAWDTFTHHGRWGVRHLPLLNEVVAGFPLYSYVQYGSSALALLLIGAFVVSAMRRLPRETPVAADLPRLTERERVLAAGLLTLAVLAGVAHRCLRSFEEITTGTEGAALFHFVPTAMFGAGAGLALGLPLHALLVRFLRRTKKHHVSS